MGECQDVFIAVAAECYIIDALHVPTVCSKESDYLGVHVLVNEEASLLLERTEIDGNHRLGKARQDGVRTIAAYRVRCPQHVPFLTSITAHEKYVEYWNSKVKTLQESARK